MQHPLTNKAKSNILSIFAIITTQFLISVEILAQLPAPMDSPFKVCWKFETDKMIEEKSASDNEKTILLPLLGGKMVSINSVSGKIIWESSLGGEIVTTPIIDKNNIFIASVINQKTLLRSLNLDSGITEWQAKLDSFGKVSLLRYKNSLILVSGNGEITTLDTKNGTIIWSKRINLNYFSVPIIVGNQLAINTKEKQILLLSIEDGNVLSKIDVSLEPVILSKIDINKLFWGDYKGSGFLIDLIEKKIEWKFRSGGEISDVSTTKKGILFASADNFIYKVSIESGKIIWKKRFDGRPSFIPFNNDEYILALSSSSEIANILDTKDGKIINQIYTEERNYNINMPTILGDLVIFSTVNGLIAYTNSSKPCVTN